MENKIDEIKMQLDRLEGLFKDVTYCASRGRFTKHDEAAVKNNWKDIVNAINLNLNQLKK